MKFYKASTSLDRFEQGHVYELAEDDPYIATGYLDEVNAGDLSEYAPGTVHAAERTDVVQDGPLPSAEENAAADKSADKPADEAADPREANGTTEEAAQDGDVEGESGAGSGSRPRRRG